MITTYRVLSLLCWLLLCVTAPAYALEPGELDAINDYCKGIADQSGKSGAELTQVMDNCVQEQKAMLQEPQEPADVALPTPDVPPQLLQKCYDQVDAWMQNQLSSGNDNLPDYDSMVDQCVTNKGVIKH